jgi:sarcosine oxidase subunit gamma
MPEPAVSVFAAPRPTLTEVRGRSIVRLRSWRADGGEGVQPLHIAGLDLPAVAGDTVSGPIRVLCVAPSEWLVVSGERSPPGARAQLESDAATSELALVDLSDALAVLELRGSGVRDVLSQGCGLDLHERAFTPGGCARTRLAQVPVLIDCREEPDWFELYVARSYLQYLHAWLIDAAAEFRDAVT